MAARSGGHVSVLCALVYPAHLIEGHDNLMKSASEYRVDIYPGSVMLKVKESIAIWKENSDGTSVICVQLRGENGIY